jgi:hypothetical protein
LGLEIVAGNGGTGPGVAGGTVIFAALAPPVTVTGPNAPAAIYYNPVSYATPSDYMPNFALANGASLTQYMLVFPNGTKAFDGTDAVTLAGFNGAAASGAPVGISLVAGSGATAAFDAPSVGTGIGITFSGYSLAGPNAAQYSLPVACCVTTLRTTGSITAALTSTPPSGSIVTGSPQDSTSNSNPNSTPTTSNSTSTSTTSTTSTSIANANSNSNSVFNSSSSSSSNPTIVPNSPFTSTSRQALAPGLTPTSTPLSGTPTGTSAGAPLTPTVVAFAAAGGGVSTGLQLAVLSGGVRMPLAATQLGDMAPVAALQPAPSPFTTPETAAAAVTAPETPQAAAFTETPAAAPYAPPYYPPKQDRH